MASQVPTQANIQSTHPFTCNTCQVAFRSGDLQRAHMQTDWHRYNLKRRVASLPPLSSEIFTEKVLANKASAAATAAKASFEKLCAACQKTYFSENAYNNHLNSQKHRQNALKAGRGAQNDDAESVSGSMISSAFSLGESMAESEATLNGDAEKDFSEVVDSIKNTNLESTDPLNRRPSRPHHSSAEVRPDHPLSPTATDESAADDDKSSVATSSKAPSDPLMDCLFCNYRSPTFPLNLTHMGKFHGMFVPEKEFLVEPENLIKYLHDKIHVGHECLKCHKILHTASGIQTHMRDRGHCMIAFESDEELVEVGEFYDFRSSYPDAAEFDEMADDSDDSTSTTDGGVKLGARRETTTTTEDDAALSSNEDDQGWETDSTVSSVPTDEITAVPIDRKHRHKSLNKSKHHNHADPRPHRAADGFHSHAHSTPHAVYHDEYELHLPSGRTAGHRSLNKYYRQNLRNYPGVAERMENAQRRLTAGSATSEDADGDIEMDGEDGEQTEGRGRQQQLITRAEGGLGMIGVSDAKKSEVRASEKREQKRQQRAQNRYQAGNEKRHNMQKHYRDPLLQ
ncbi:pre-60S factor rei1 [Coniothyrium glycines]